MRPRAAIFLDRDGTINAKPGEGDYVKSPAELELLEGSAAAIRRLNDAGIAVIVVTNQRGIALERMTEADLARVHAELDLQLLTSAGARVDAYFHCPHEIGQCDCRKPLPGLFLQAQSRFSWIDLRRSVMIGDSDSDTAAARAVEIPAVQLGRDAPNLSAAVDAVLDAWPVGVGC